MKRPAKRSMLGRLTRFLAFGGMVGTAVYFFDPRMGRARRNRLVDRLAGKARRGARELERKAEYSRGQVEGLRHAATPDLPPENDPTLVDKVESEVLTRWEYPKGQINVNAADGIVELRGVCDTSGQIDEIEQRVRKVTGVVDVHNYLHLPNTPPPNKRDALDAGRG